MGFNIPLILLLSMSSLARVYRQPDCERLVDASAYFLREWSLAAERGFHEGVCYEGYVRYFAEILILSTGKTTLLADSDQGFVTRCHYLGPADDPGDLARIGDVEPDEMPFCWSALIRMNSQRRGMGIPLIGRHPSRLRAETLHGLAIHPECLREVESGRPPAMLDLGYAVRLTPRAPHRWFSLVARQESPANHLPPDLGHVVVSDETGWLITDPGYQQYLPTSERTFSRGHFAHNTPVIDGNYVSRKFPLPALESWASEAGCGLRLDLTPAYEARGEIIHVIRHVLQPEAEETWILDFVSLRQSLNVGYFWHGEPDAYWHQAGPTGPFLLHRRGKTFRLSCFAPVEPAGMEVTRLKGSRGHLTLHAKFHARNLQVAWHISRGESSEPTGVAFAGKGVELHCNSGLPRLLRFSPEGYAIPDNA